MDTTGVAIVSGLVGAAVGYAVAKLTTRICSSHFIDVDPASTPADLGEQHLCKGYGHQVQWRTTNGAKLNVTWTSIQPTTAPYPFVLNCTNYINSSCLSGPMVANAVRCTASYELRVQGSASPWNGRIIIDK